MSDGVTAPVRSPPAAGRSAAKLTARDFKHSRRRGFDLERWREFGAGLGIGLVVALLAFVLGQRSAGGQGAEEAPLRPEPRPAAHPTDAAEPEEQTAKYDFYEMLPQFEVIVPEKEQDVRRDVPTAKIERPGVYVLQAGSYRRVEDADRVRAQLERQGIEALVQRVAVDADVWHRVRIGPVSDLGELNRLRAQLHAAELDALVIRVGE